MMLGADELELVWEKLASSDCLEMRGVCRAWRDGIDQRLSQENTAYLCTLLDAMRIDASRAMHGRVWKRWCMRYTSPPSRLRPIVYRCAKCHEIVGQLGCCPVCKPGKPVHAEMLPLFPFYDFYDLGTRMIRFVGLCVFFPLFICCAKERGIMV